LIDFSRPSHADLASQAGVGRGFVLAAALLPRSAFAAAYADHPIRMVMPFNTGGNVDAVARLIAARMSECWVSR
jgi:tripartite-type tricarboxylate transporter receptor subunit TctC